MKVTILHSVSNKDIAYNAGKIIKDNSCTVFYADSDLVWNKDYTKNPLTIFDSITHFLYIHSHLSQDIETFAFFAGLAIGRGIRIIILEIDSKFSIPLNSLHLCTVLNLSTFEEYLKTEKQRFIEEDKKNFARKTLNERGIPCFDDNFIHLTLLGDIESVKLFIDAGFDTAIIDSAGTPLLSLSVRAQFPEVVSILLSAGADVNKQSLDRGYSPLMDSAQKGDVAIATILLEHGALTNLKSKDGQTALIICAGRGDVEFSRLLMYYGADPAIKDNLGMTALAYAKLFKNESLILLFNNGSV